MTSASQPCAATGRCAPAIERGFQDALAKFKVRMTAEERDRFKFTTLDDVRRTVLDIQQKQLAKAEGMHLARLQGFLEGCKQLGEVVEVFLNTSEVVAFVWGPLKFLLNVSIDPTQYRFPQCVIVARRQRQDPAFCRVALMHH